MHLCYAVILLKGGKVQQEREDRRAQIFIYVLTWKFFRRWLHSLWLLVVYNIKFRGESRELPGLF